MEASEDENASAIICRRVSSGKRRHQELSCGTQHHKDDRHLQSLSNVSKKPWIANSFMRNAESAKNENDDDLDTSDLMMAEIDMDLLTAATDGLCSPHQKKTCSTKHISDKKETTQSLSTVFTESILGDNCDSEFFHGEQDLFEDDGFDDLFFMNREMLSQTCMSEKSDYMNKHVQSLRKNICDQKDKQHAGNSDLKIEPGYNMKVDNSGRMRETRTETSTAPSKTHAKVRQFSSLKDRLKQRLQKNAGASPSHQGIESKLKEEALSKARIDASQIRKEGTEVDIGPFYGLTSKVQELFEKVKGIGKLYDWQDECLNLPAVREKKNLIYSLPTSGGKTLVAEVLILKELLCYQRDALLVLPFVSIVQEKVRGISEFASELGFLVEEYAGSKGRFPPMKRSKKKSLYIATIEKGHSLINSLIETGRLECLGLVVVDELHMLGEGGSRGAALESTLLKILHSKANTQIIGMSATLNNISDIQTFLHAEIYFNDFRPVSLQEYVKIEDNLFSVNPQALSKDERLEHSRITIFPNYSLDMIKRDPDQLLGLVTEVIPDKSCLVFCSTKKNCENVAYMLSELMCKYQRPLMEVNKEKRKELLQELHTCGNSKICPTLSYTIFFGIAYHHSGLTMDERRLIEEAYSQGTLCLLTCTSTLAAGVNLPAKRVILRSPYVGMDFIKHSQYKQMTGRAGRAGLDSSGESILISCKRDRLLVKDLLSGPKDYCHSSLLYDGGKGIQSLLLSSIGLRIITTTDSAFSFLSNSFLNIQYRTEKASIKDVCKEALQYLIDEQLVVQGYKNKTEGDGQLCLDVTPLGKATFKGSVNHVHSSLLYKDLKAAEQSLVLSNHFHLLYLVTPYDMAFAVTPAWDVYFRRFCQLSETELHVATLVGISENFLSRKSIGLSSRQKIDTLATNRFYLTLMLWDLWNQHSVWDVSERFTQSRGFVQNLLSSSSSFASCVYHFCQELEEFWAYPDLLGNLVKRLSYCVTAELIPLMEVPGVLAARAKQLYSAGICNLTSLAGADTDDLASRIEHLSKRNARQMISAAKNLIEEKTALLMEEVENLVVVTGTES